MKNTNSKSYLRFTNLLLMNILFVFLATACSNNKSSRFATQNSASATKNQPAQPSAPSTPFKSDSTAKIAFDPKTSTTPTLITGLVTAIDGGWSDWNSTSQCDRICGGGSQNFIRLCNQPSPSNGGKFCEGNSLELRSCNTQACPGIAGGPPICNSPNCGAVDGGWSGWSGWSACNLTCGGGSQSRSRTCSAPLPVNGGQSCTGNVSESQSCNTQSCPVSIDIRYKDASIPFYRNFRPDLGAAMIETSPTEGSVEGYTVSRLLFRAPVSYNLQNCIAGVNLQRWSFLVPTVGHIFDYRDMNPDGNPNWIINGNTGICLIRNNPFAGMVRLYRFVNTSTGVRDWKINDSSVPSPDYILHPDEMWVYPP